MPEFQGEQLAHFNTTYLAGSCVAGGWPAQSFVELFIDFIQQIADALEKICN